MPRRYLLLCAILIMILFSSGATITAETDKLFLHKDWQLQSSCEVKAGGAEISVAGFNASGWHKTEVPSTVVGALVTDKTYPDAMYGTNLKSFPGMDYSS